VDDVAAGEHTVGLSGLPANCQLQGTSSLEITVRPGAAETVTFVIVCAPPPAETGTLAVTTATTGTDPDGYVITVDAGTPQPIGINATVTIANVVPGPHSIELSGLDPACSVVGANPQSATLSAGSTTAISFAVQCTTPGPATGSIQVRVSTTGTGLDPDGYTLLLDGVVNGPFGPNDERTLPGLAAGQHTVELRGLAPTCAVVDNPRAVTVTGGATADVTFAVTCGSAGSRIAFSSNGFGLQAIFVVNPDGTGLQRLSPADDAGDSEPVWSPDGSRMLFSSNDDLWVMNADGSSRVRLVDADGVASYRWSPDGGRIAYLRERREGEDSFFDLWVAASDGTGQERIALNATYPSWSPDGLRIAYSRDFPELQVHVINADGSGDTPITSPPVQAFQTAWSPTGNRIAFVTVSDKDIMLINPDGSGMVNLSPAQTDDDTPVWSPDGSRMAFNTAADNQISESEIAVMNGDGSGRVNLTNRPGFDFGPDWSPDGTRLVFTRSDPGNSEVYVVNVDGTNPINLSNRPGVHDTSPSWGGQRPPVLAGRLANLLMPLERD
jgi:Tol biopolymer transport system component